MALSISSFRERLNDLDRGVLDLILALKSLKRNLDILAIESPALGILISRFKHALRDHYHKISSAIDLFDEGIKGIYHGPEFKYKDKFLANLQLDIKLFESIEKQLEYYGTESLLTIHDYNIAKSAVEQMITRVFLRLDHLSTLTSTIKKYYKAG